MQQFQEGQLVLLTFKKEDDPGLTSLDRLQVDGRNVILDSNKNIRFVRKMKKRRVYLADGR